MGAVVERADPDDPCNTHANYPYNEQSKILINRRRGANGAWLGFRSGTEWNVSQPNSGGRLALPWDYNRDGRTDLLTSARRAWLYRNTGTGFAEVSRAVSVALPTFNGASIADITGDAIPDLVFADDTGFAYRAGTSAGISLTTVRLGPATSGGIGETTAVGDINGDGLQDVYGQVASPVPGGGNPDDLVFVASTAGWQRHVVPAAAVTPTTWPPSPSEDAPSSWFSTATMIRACAPPDRFSSSPGAEVVSARWAASPAVAPEGCDPGLVRAHQIDDVDGERSRRTTRSRESGRCPGRSGHGG